MEQTFNDLESGALKILPDDFGTADRNTIASMSWQMRREIRRIANVPKKK